MRLRRPLQLGAGCDQLGSGVGDRGRGRLQFVGSRLQLATKAVRVRPLRRELRRSVLKLFAGDRQRAFKLRLLTGGDVEVANPRLELLARRVPGGGLRDLRLGNSLQLLGSRLQLPAKRVRGRPLRRQLLRGGVTLLTRRRQLAFELGLPASDGVELTNSRLEFLPRRVPGGGLRDLRLGNSLQLVGTRLQLPAKGVRGRPLRRQLLRGGLTLLTRRRQLALEFGLPASDGVELTEFASRTPARVVSQAADCETCVSDTRCSSWVRDSSSRRSASAVDRSDVNCSVAA